MGFCSSDRTKQRQNLPYFSRYSFFLILGSVFPLILTGCFSSPVSPPVARNEIPPSPQELRAPEEIHFSIEVKDYKIIDHSIVTTDLGAIVDLQVDPNGTTDGRSVFYRVFPLPAGEFNFYYVLKIPEIRSGGLRVTAQKYHRKDASGTPPRVLNVTILVVNRKVVGIGIDDYTEKAYRIHYERKEYAYGRWFLIVRSLDYPNARWRLALPTSNGTFRGRAFLINE